MPMTLFALPLFSYLFSIKIESICVTFDLFKRCLFSNRIHFNKKCSVDRYYSMGNKNSSSHFTNHQNNLFTHPRKSNYYITKNDDINAKFDASHHQSSNTKKHGPSPRFRRRHGRQVHLDKKTKKSQV